MPITRESWIDEIERLTAAGFEIDDQRLDLKSPQFRFKKSWRICPEHQKQFKTVVMQWIVRGRRADTPPGARPCPPADKRKGWHFRQSLTPARLAGFLGGLPSQTPTIAEIEAQFEQRIANVRKLSAGELGRRLAAAPRKPKRLVAQVTYFERSPYVVAAALRRAAGTCECCHKPAPFSRRSDGSPYLEVHHVISLGEGGDDTLENVLALCPNCHRREHHG
jgi:hypothetical protein